MFPHRINILSEFRLTFMFFCVHLVYISEGSNYVDNIEDNLRTALNNDDPRVIESESPATLIIN